MHKALLPIDVTRIKSFRPCESCGLRKVRYRAKVDPPGQARVTHELCDNCIEAIRN